jgi:putative tryptophan/tyrosine transport system substrate-binding protein
MTNRIGRRSFLTLLGGAAATWPLAARAQQQTVPVVGFLVSGSAEGYADFVAAVREGLRSTSYIEGRNVAIEYRWADEQYDRLSAMAAELVGRRVAVIFALGSVLPAQAAKTATATIPIVFANGSDPIKLGLVVSLNRPGGNATGMTFFGTELGPKRLELLHEMVPKAAVIAMLVKPDNPNTEPSIAEMQAAARVIGVQIAVVGVRSESDFDTAFAKIVQQRAGALVIGSDTLFNAPHRREQLSALTIRHAVPTIGSGRDFVDAGGLISYGTNVLDMYRQAGVYVGRILKGEKPADLPVMQPAKFELVVSRKTAKALGLDVPTSILLRADEVIE